MAKPVLPRSLVIVPETHVEHPDPQPLAIPARMRVPERLQDTIARLVKRSVDDWAQQNGHETFEESEDFEVDDEVDPRSAYEEFFDPVLERNITAEEFRQNREAYKKRYVQQKMQYFAQLDEDGAIQRNLFRSSPLHGSNQGGAQAGKAGAEPSGTAQNGDGKGSPK